MRRKDEKIRPYASPPCLMHDHDADQPGAVSGPDGDTPEDIAMWRRRQRERLLGVRMALAPATRHGHTERICMFLREEIRAVRGLAVGFYWPIRGEPDLRDLLAEFAAAGVRCALPVIGGRGEPIVYQSWAPGEPLERGFWNIPVPVRGQPVQTDIVIAPVVGFDARCFRLGYGGGYFDRTLHVDVRVPRAIGVGYSITALATIHPQPHDVPMEVIVTEAGPVRPAAPID